MPGPGGGDYTCIYDSRSIEYCRRLKTKTMDKDLEEA